MAQGWEQLFKLSRL